MSSRIFWLSTVLALAASSATATTSAPGYVRPVAARVLISADFDADLAAFEVEMDAWKDLLDDTEDRAEKRALRKNHPAEAFTESMRAHFAAGEVRAADWCLENLKDLGLKRKDREVLRLELYDALIEASAPEIRERTLERMLKDSSLARALNFAGLEERVMRFNAHETDSNQRGRAIYLLSAKFARSRDEAESVRAVKMLQDLLAAPSGADSPASATPVATLSSKTRKEAEKLLFAVEHLEVGKIAPDFTGKTIDGEAVSLADTRGDVTVLSFFGFW